MHPVNFGIISKLNDPGKNKIGKRQKPKTADYLYRRIFKNRAPIIGRPKQTACQRGAKQLISIK